MGITVGLLKLNVEERDLGVTMHKSAKLQAMCWSIKKALFQL